MALEDTDIEVEQQSGEVIKLHPQKSPSYVEAVRDLATFKFGLYRTVAADPILYGVPCLNFIVVFSDFVSVDKKTLQRTPAYASNATIAARAGLKSHNTAAKARRLLEANGYMVAIGTHNGMTVYRLENPHIERVQMHVRELEEYNRSVRADQKQSWNARKKRMSKNDTPDNERVSEVDTPEKDEGVNICHPRVSEIDMQGCQDMTSNKLEETLENKLNTRSEGNGSFPHDVERGICGVGNDDEGGRGEAPTQPAPIPPVSYPHEKKNGYAAAKGGNSFETDAPFNIPSTRAEAVETLEWLFEGEFQNLAPLIQNFAQTAIMAGNLRPSWVKARLANLNNTISTGDA